MAEILLLFFLFFCFFHVVVVIHVVVDPGNLLLKFGQNWVSNS